MLSWILMVFIVKNESLPSHWCYMIYTRLISPGFEGWEVHLQFSFERSLHVLLWLTASKCGRTIYKEWDRNRAAREARTVFWNFSASLSWMDAEACISLCIVSVNEVWISHKSTKAWRQNASVIWGINQEVPKAR